MESSLVSEGPLDSTPSITSPVDSGVALIDSDIDRSEVRVIAARTKLHNTTEKIVKHFLASDPCGPTYSN